VELAAFLPSARGVLVPIDGFDPRFGEQYEHQAFVPYPLPTPALMSAETYELIDRATSAVARLDQAVNTLPNPKLLNRPAIRREAQSTSALEGTFVAFTDVLEADFADAGDLTRDVREVYNSVLAAEYAFEVLPTRGITKGLLLDLQRQIVSKTQADNEDAGRIRTTQVFIGVSRRRVPDARFVPPPPDHQLSDGLDALVEWINTASGPVLLRAALAHYQFEALHPFTDGNGRIGRLLAILQLVHGELLREPVLNLSPWFEQQREDYQDHLLNTSYTGDFDPWVRFFCTAVQQQAQEQSARVERLLAWKTATRLRLQNQGARGVALQIAEDLIGYPAITPTLAAKIYGRTYQACNTAIGKLVEAGVLEERSGKRYNRIFYAADVLRIIED
jgi:Fic family protein